MKKIDLLFEECMFKVKKERKIGKHTCTVGEAYMETTINLCKFPKETPNPTRNGGRKSLKVSQKR